MVRAKINWDDYKLYWHNYYLTLNNKVNFKDLYRKKKWGEYKTYNDVYKELDSIYKKDDNYLYILEGYNILNAWVSEQNCIVLINYLKNIYSDAVLQVLNA